MFKISFILLNTAFFRTSGRHKTLRVNHIATAVFKNSLVEFKISQRCPLESLIDLEENAFVKSELALGLLFFHPTEFHLHQ